MKNPRQKRQAFELHVARMLGVSPAGLVYLASLAATGRASQRGSETVRLQALDLITPNTGSTEFGRDGHWWRITQSGRELVARARKLGW